MDTFEDENETLKKNSTSAEKIDSLFQLVSDRFGIEDTWKKIIRIRHNKKPPLSYKHIIKLPLDLSTVEFITELNSFMNFEDTRLKIEEEEINGDSNIEVYSADTLRYWAVLVRDKDIKREMGSFSFIVADIDQLTKDEFQKLFYSPFPFTVLIEPSTASINLSEFIIESQKEYCLILNDETTEEIYTLDPEYSKKRLERSIINIVKNFKDAVYFYFSKTSDIYNSTSFNFVVKEFEQRGRLLKDISKVNRIEGESAEDVNSLFDFYHQSLVKNDHKNILIDADKFLVIESRIKNIVNRGYKIINLSEVAD